MSEKVMKDDPRARRTRQMLQTAMMEIMAEKKFSAINIQDITARAGLNRATFYAHFDDKYDLVNAIIRQHFQNALNARISQDAGLTCGNLKILIQTVYEYVDSFPGHCSGAHLHHDHGLVVRQTQLQLYEVLLQWLKRCPTPEQSADSKITSQREHSPRATREMVAMMTSWAIFGPILQSTWSPHKIPLEELTEQLMALLPATLRGYLTPEQPG